MFLVGFTFSPPFLIKESKQNQRSTEIGKNGKKRNGEEEENKRANQLGMVKCYLHINSEYLLQNQLYGIGFSFRFM